MTPLLHSLRAKRMLLRIARLSNNEQLRRLCFHTADTLVIARGDPAGLSVTTQIPDRKPPKDPSTVLKDHSDVILMAMKQLSGDKELAEVVDSLNKRATGLQKDFAKISKLLIDRLLPKDSKPEEGADMGMGGGAEGGLLKQTTLKVVTDAIEVVGKDLKPYVDIAVQLKQLHEQTKKEHKVEPVHHKRKNKKRAPLKHKDD